MTKMTMKEWAVAALMIVLAATAYAPCIDRITASQVQVGQGIVIDTRLGAEAGMLTVRYGDETFSINSEHGCGVKEKGSIVDVVEIRGSIMNYGYSLR